MLGEMDGSLLLFFCRAVTTFLPKAVSYELPNWEPWDQTPCFSSSRYATEDRDGFNWGVTSQV